MAERAGVVIVGAGPAGSATAIHLARAGHAVTLIDRARFPREKACSEYLSPETVRHLATLGVLDALDAHGGTALEGTRVRAAHGASLIGRFADAGGSPFRATGLAMPRRILDATLLDAARVAGVTVHEETTLRVLSGMNAHGRTVTLEDAAGARHDVQARCVVGADGLRSVVARQAGLHRQGWLKRVAFVAHVEGVTGLGRVAEMHVGKTGYVGLNPLGHGIANVALVVPAALAAQARGDAAAFFHRQLEQLPGVHGRVDPARTVREVMVTGPFAASSRRSTADGLLLVGDAADFFDPFTGEGVCSALAGAAFAAETLDEALRASGPVTAGRLASYRHARRRAFLGKWIVERLIGYAMLSPRLFDRAVARLDRRGMADTLIGVTGDFVSPWRVVNPWFLGRMVV
ncbi:MAG: FAD-dependent monooxygenase [Gemmatimonadetes bacterium]|nr:FAD-dependent monooxygenase [Gemmatimonadota bacterium]